MKKPKKFANGGMTLLDAQKMLKAGNTAGAQNAMRQIVGLPAQMTAPASAAPSLQSAQNMLRGGNNIGAQDMMRRIVGLPSAAPKRNIFGISSSRAPATPATPATPAMGGPGPSRTLGPSSTQSMQMMAKGGSVSASKRGDGCAQRGKTKGRVV